MEPGFAIVGLVAGAVVGVGVERQQRSARRQAARLDSEGTATSGVIRAADPTGRYGSWTRLAIDTPFGRLVETVPTAEAGAAGWTVGALVPLRVDPGAPTRGRIDRPASGSGRAGVGVGVGAVIVGLGVAAALVS